MAIIVEVHEAFMHCAKALRRSKLWMPESQQDRSEMTSMIGMIMEQSSGKPADRAELPAAEESLEAEYKNTMY